MANVKEACVHGRKSVGGLDEWTPADLALLPDEAYRWVAVMLNLIECGANWPEGMNQAKAAFLVKDPAKAEDPLAYRVLLILAAIHRRLAAIGLWHMGEWVESRAEPMMYAGVKGRGTEDGWYTTAVAIELARCLGLHVTLGATDVFKCFDKLLRTITYQLATLMGMPKRVIDTYRRFQEGMAVRSAVAGGLGQRYKKATSIPHGRPLSMMLVSLIMRP